MVDGSQVEDVARLLHAAIPEWQSQVLVPVKISGGMTNQNYCVKVADATYFVRIASEGSERLGIFRDDEYQANRIAGNLGVAPDVCYYLPGKKILVTTYVQGRVIGTEEFQDRHRLQQVVDILKTIHQTTPNVRRFSVFDMVADYYGLVRQRDAALGQRISRLLAWMEAHSNYLPTIPMGLCHNDLLAANFVCQEESNHRLWLVDWEYAGIGTPYFDLANFASNQQLSSDLERLMLELYFGPDDLDYQVAAIHVMRLWSDLREALWAFVQQYISLLDFDFTRYGEGYLLRVEQRLADPATNQAHQVLMNRNTRKGDSH